MYTSHLANHIKRGKCYTYNNDQTYCDDIPEQRGGIFGSSFKVSIFESGGKTTAV